MWCLACSANGYVADRDDRHLEGARLKHADFEQRVAQSDGQPVEPAERQQPLVDSDEVALHDAFLTVS